MRSLLSTGHRPVNRTVLLEGFVSEPVPATILVHRGDRLAFAIPDRRSGRAFD
jgi:hypothetical protein